MSRVIIVILVVVAIIAFIWFLAQRGLDIFEDTSSNLNIDVSEIIPATWTPRSDGLLVVNIDGDPDLENLLFYTYDGGLWGGVIYDAQNAPLGDPQLSPPQQSPTYLVPYRLQSDYAAGKPSDYLGDDSVTWNDIYIRTDGDPAAADTVSRDRVQVRGEFRGRTTRFSAFWWLDKSHGYGGATASTPGWFSLSRSSPTDWVAWDAGAAITELWSWEPQTDRSNLCRRVPWTLVGGDQYLPQGPFVKNDGAADLSFCSGQIPGDPAYPEAQVLAWLFDKNSNRLSPSAQGIQPYESVRVLRITAPADLSTQVDGRVVATGEVDFTASNGANMMQWSAELVPPADIQDQVHWKILRLTPR